MSVIRTITFELLRHGPAHGQLLSPLNRYLGLCGNHAPATVTQPFEHQHFLGRLNTLRYEDSQQTRQIQLRDMAQRMAETLATVPGLIAELCETPETDLTHLELVLSAAELALLPFELADAPEGFPGAGQSLALQKQMRMTITRQARRANPVQFTWRRPPRILFVAASPPGVGEIPLEAHLQILREVVDPWVKFYRQGDRAGRARQLNPHLVIVLEASLADIQAICRQNDFTHVHVLAHGVPIVQAGETHYGLALHDHFDRARVDRVSGERLAGALRTNQPALGDRLSEPIFVSLASCDSGQGGSVLGAGGSIAHALHAAGIPLVVGSQFPLTFEGSVVMVRTLYQRLLEGDDPRRVLWDLRQQLLLNVPESHDWASIVAYSALPTDIEVQLQELRLNQAKRSIEAALDVAKSLAQTASQLDVDHSDLQDSSLPSLTREQTVEIDHAFNRLERGRNRLQRILAIDGAALSPSVVAEIQGLIGQAEKREAHLLFRFSNLFNDEKLREYRERSQAALRRAREHFEAAFAKDPRRFEYLVESLSLSIILSEEIPRLEDQWQLARLLAEQKLAASREKLGWVHGILAEIHLLSAAINLGPRGKAARKKVIALAEAKAVEQARALAHIEGKGAPPVLAAGQQIELYREWYYLISKHGAYEDLRDISENILKEFGAVARP